MPAVTINENAGVQSVNVSCISSGATNENQTLTVTATSSNTGLIPNPTVSYTRPNSTGSLTFAPISVERRSWKKTRSRSYPDPYKKIASSTFNVTVNGVKQQTTI